MMGMLSRRIRAIDVSKHFLADGSGVELPKLMQITALPALGKTKSPHPSLLKGQVQRAGIPAFVKGQVQVDAQSTTSTTPTAASSSTANSRNAQGGLSPDSSASTAGN